MLIIISVADAVKETLGDLKESFIRRFVFLRSVLDSEAELTDAKMLEVFDLYQSIEQSWASYIRETQFVECNRPVTFSYLRELLVKVRAFEVLVLGKLISMAQLSRDQRTDVYYECLGVLKMIDKTFDDLDDVEDGRRSLFLNRGE